MTHRKPEKLSKPAPPPAAPATAPAAAPAVPAPKPLPVVQPATSSLLTQKPQVGIVVPGPSFSNTLAASTSSPHRGSSPDAEADGEAEDGEDNLNAREEEAKDGESETIIRQLEKGLPRWEGFGDQGWMEDVPNERLAEIVHAIKSYKDVV
jgi:chromatin structure-remodeling complex subunit RSC1/2